MIALDTNIWIYSHDTRYPEKQRQSQELIRSADPLVLLWQVGCEFIAASRKLEPFGFSQEDAWTALVDMCEGKPESLLEASSGSGMKTAARISPTQEPSTDLQ